MKSCDHEKIIPVTDKVTGGIEKICVVCGKVVNQKIVVTFHGADIQKDMDILYGYRFDKKYEKLLSKTIHLFDKVFAISDDIIKELSFFNLPK